MSVSLERLDQTKDSGREKRASGSEGKEYVVHHECRLPLPPATFIGPLRGGAFRRVYVCGEAAGRLADTVLTTVASADRVLTLFGHTADTARHTHVCPRTHTCPHYTHIFTLHTHMCPYYTHGSNALTPWNGADHILSQHSLHSLIHHFGALRLLL